jgi:hypothetical protein
MPGVGQMANRPKYQRSQKPHPKEKRQDQTIVPDVSNHQCLMIGKIMVAWAKLEAALQAAIWEFLGLHEEEGRLLTGRLDARPKIEMLGPLSEKFLPDGPFANALFEALGRIGELAEDRNFIAHGVWATLKPEDVPIATSLRPKSIPNRVVAETFPQERMDSILHDIAVAHNIIVRLPIELAATRPSRNPKEN